MRRQIFAKHSFTFAITSTLLAVALWLIFGNAQDHGGPAPQAVPKPAATKAPPEPVAANPVPREPPLLVRQEMKEGEIFIGYYAKKELERLGWMTAPRPSKRRFDSRAIPQLEMKPPPIHYRNGFAMRDTLWTGEEESHPYHAYFVSRKEAEARYGKAENATDWRMPLERRVDDVIRAYHNEHPSEKE